MKKKGGGTRPILDRRGLNEHLKTFRFKLLTTASLLHTARRGDWFTSLDRHIPVYASHRKFRCFSSEGRVYEYTVLSFGMGKVTRCSAWRAPAGLLVQAHTIWALMPDSVSRVQIPTLATFDAAQGVFFKKNRSQRISENFQV